MAELPIRILSEAAKEARKAHRWYAVRSPQAAERFLEEVERGIEQIRSFPGRWPEHLYNTRRYLLHRFPFLLIYRVKPDVIELVACQHGRRRPGYWRARVE